jgi:TP901 family phage tail tape measure protein
MAVDTTKTVVIDLKAQGDIGTSLTNLTAQFVSLSDAVNKLKADIGTALSSISAIKFDPSFVAGIDAIKSLSGVKLPKDLEDFAKGLAEVAKVSGRSPSLTSFYNAVKQFDGLKVPALLQFAQGLWVLGDAAASDKVDKAAPILTRLKTSLDEFKFKIPDLAGFARGLTALAGIKDLTGIVANLGAMVAPLTSLGAITIPSLGSFANGMKTIQGLNIKTIVDNIKALALALQNLDKAGFLKSFATLANDLKNLTTNLQNNLGPLQQMSQALTKVADSTSKASSGTKSFGERLTNYIQYRIIADSIMKMQEAFWSSIDVIRDYDQSLKDLQAITGATGTEVGMMGKTIIDVAENTKFSAGQVAEGMKILGQAGFSAAESMQTIRAVSDLATGTLSTMKETVDLVTTSLRVFDISSANSAHVADVFATAVNKSKLDIEQLRTAMNYIGPVAKDAGASFEETAAAMMSLANSGQRASTIGTGLRLLFSELVDPPKKLKDAIEAAGMTMDQFNPATQGMKKVLSNLNLVVTDAGMAFDIFGKRGAAAVLTLKDSSGDYSKMLSALSTSGSAAKMAAIQMEGLGVMIKNLKDKIELLAISLGNAGVTAVFRILVDVSRNLVDALDTLINSSLGGFIVKLGMVVIASGGVLTILGKLVESYKALAFVMVNNVAAGASIIGSKVEIGRASLALGNILKSLRTIIVSATTAMIAFVTAGTLMNIVLTGVAVWVALLGIVFLKAASSVNDFKESTKEAVEEASKFKNLGAGIDEYDKRIRGLAEGSEELKNANIGLRAELFKSAEGNYEVSKSAIAAALSIDPFTGAILNNGEAIKEHRKLLADLEFKKVVKSANDSASGMMEQAGSLSTFFSDFKDDWSNVGNEVSRTFSAIFTKKKSLAEELKKIYEDDLDYKWRSDALDSLNSRIEEGKTSLEELSRFAADLVSKGNLSGKEKKFLEYFDTQFRQSGELLTYVRQVNGISLSDADKTFEDAAKKAGATTDAIRMMMDQLKLAREEQSKSEDNTPLASFIKDYEKGTRTLTEFKDEYLAMREASKAAKFSKEEVEAITGLDAIGAALAERLVLLREDQEARLASAGNDKVKQLEANALTQEENRKANEEIKQFYRDRVQSFAYMSAQQVNNFKLAEQEKLSILQKAVDDGHKTVEEAELETRKIRLDTEILVQKAMDETFDPKRFHAAQEEYRRQLATTISRIRRDTVQAELDALQNNKNPKDAKLAGTNKENAEYANEMVRVTNDLLGLKKKLQEFDERGTGTAAQRLELTKQIEIQEKLEFDTQAKYAQLGINTIKETQAAKLEELKTLEDINERSTRIAVQDSQNASRKKIEALDAQLTEAKAIDDQAARLEKVTGIQRKMHEEVIKQKEKEEGFAKSQLEYAEQIYDDNKKRAGEPVQKGSAEEVYYLDLIAKKREALNKAEAASFQARHADRTSEIQLDKDKTQLQIQEQTNAQKTAAEKRADALQTKRESSEDRISRFETEKLAVSQWGDEVKRSLELQRINKDISDERISEKKNEVEAAREAVRESEKLVNKSGSMQEENAINSEKIKTKKELMGLTKALAQAEHQARLEALADAKDVAQKELTEAEFMFKQKEGGAARYQAALARMNELGLISNREYNEKMIESSDSLFDGMMLGFRRAKASIESDAKFMADMTSKIVDSIAGGFSSAFQSWINGTDTAADAFRKFAVSVLDQMGQMIMKQQMLNLMKAMMPATDKIGAEAGSGGDSGGFFSGFVASLKSIFGGGESAASGATDAAASTAMTTAATAVGTSAISLGTTSMLFDTSIMMFDTSIAMLTTAATMLSTAASMLSTAAFNMTAQSSGEGIGGMIGGIGSAVGSGKALGGIIEGYSPSDIADNIPIRATAGEFMHPVAAVRKYGIGFMEAIRTLRFPNDLANAISGVNVRSRSSYRLAEGGLVPSGNTTLKSGDTKLKIVNVMDKGLVKDMLTSSEGVTTILNILRKNSTEVRAIYG